MKSHERYLFNLKLSFGECIIFISYLKIVKKGKCCEIRTGCFSHFCIIHAAATTTTTTAAAAVQHSSTIYAFRWL